MEEVCSYITREKLQESLLLAHSYKFFSAAAKDKLFRGVLRVAFKLFFLFVK